MGGRPVSFCTISAHDRRGGATERARGGGAPGSGCTTLMGFPVTAEAAAAISASPSSSGPVIS